MSVLLIGQQAEGTAVEESLNAEKCLAFLFVAKSHSLLTELQFHTAAGTQTAKSVVVGIMANNPATTTPIVASAEEKTHSGEPAPNTPYTVGGFNYELMAGEAYWLFILPIGGILHIKTGLGSELAENKEPTKVKEAKKVTAWKYLATEGPMYLAGLGTETTGTKLTRPATDTLAISESVSSHFAGNNRALTDHLSVLEQRQGPILGVNENNWAPLGNEGETFAEREAGVRGFLAGSRMHSLRVAGVGNLQLAASMGSREMAFILTGAGAVIYNNHNLTEMWSSEAKKEAWLTYALEAVEAAVALGPGIVSVIEVGNEMWSSGGGKLNSRAEGELYGEMCQRLINKVKEAKLAFEIPFGLSMFCAKGTEGGVPKSAAAWLEPVLKGGPELKEIAGGLVFHPYGPLLTSPVEEEPAENRVVNMVFIHEEALNLGMEAHACQGWITEWGVTIAGAGSEAKQHALAKEVISYLISLSWVQGVWWFALIDEEKAKSWGFYPRGGGTNKEGNVEWSTPREIKTIVEVYVPKEASRTIAKGHPGTVTDTLKLSEAVTAVVGNTRQLLVRFATEALELVEVIKASGKGSRRVTDLLTLIEKASRKLSTQKGKEEEEEEERERERMPLGPSAGYVVSLRTRAPLRLSIDVATPDGRHYRWGADDPNPVNSPMNLSFSSVMPGGFERMSATLERDSRLLYPDTAKLLATLTVQGAGGTVAWQGRLDKTPDTGGYQQQETQEAVGWQAQLEDDSGAREIYVDQELSKWEGPTLREQIALRSAEYNLQSSSVSANPSGLLPALVQSFTGAGESKAKQMVEAWYNAHGIEIGRIYWSVTQGENVPGSGLWGWDVFASSDDILSAVDTEGNLFEGPPSNTRVASPGRFWACLRFYYGAAGGASEILYALYWQKLAIYGRHGLELYGEQPQGVLASDVVANAISRWAPKLGYSTGPGGTIPPSAFIIPQLAFLEPTTVAEILKQATRFELLDWAVWEGPTFYMNQRGARGKGWRARVAPAQLEQAGPQVARLWNGVIVSFTDAAGITRTVGPLGSGMETQTSALEDADPENPVNEAGIRHWAKLQMGTSTVAGAEQVGAIFLRESLLLETSGQGSLTGHVEDESGVLWPAWQVRAGDTVSFVDAADQSPRRVIHASYDDSTKICQVALDQPPDGMQQLLERLSVSTLVSTGLS